MDTYYELSQQLHELKEKEQFDHAIDTCDAIIALILNNRLNIELSKWKEEKVSLILNLKIKFGSIKPKSATTNNNDEAIKKRINPDWNLYFSFLMRANTLESTNKLKSKELLYKCLILLKLDEHDFVTRFPNRKSDKDAIVKRLSNMG